MTHEKGWKSFYAIVTESLIGAKNGNKDSWYFKATTISSEFEFYKYTKANYTTPNLIKNLITNDDFSGTSGWTGVKFNNKEISFKPTNIDTGSKRSYPRIAWEHYTSVGHFQGWTLGDGAEAGRYYCLLNATISD
jgi:hypothetical protein